MQNFVYKNPTEILFGKGMIREIAGRIPKDLSVLFLYGGGSIKKNSVYEQVKTALEGRPNTNQSKRSGDWGGTDYHDEKQNKSQCRRVIEFGGIEPNPLYETCLKAVEAVKKEKVGFILAVGGGSVLDAAKFIAAAACFSGTVPIPLNRSEAEIGAVQTTILEKKYKVWADPWTILLEHGANVKAALPIGTVLTLPATGSEANGNSVISRGVTREKLHFFSPYVFPRFSVLDPETTFSLPVKQVRNGIVDAFVHVMEQYITYPARAPLQDRMAEALLQTLIEIAPAALSKTKDYETRATFMWSATLALNTLVGCGVPQDWSTHMIAHELTAFYGLDHAETLAIVLPGVWQYKLTAKKKKLEQYGRRVWNVKTAKEAILKTEAFFHSIKMPTHLGDYKISAKEAARKVRERFKERDSVFGEHGDITPDAVAKIIASRA
jgi:NADP-dependent alcohol dehydrogenase